MIAWISSMKLQCLKESMFNGTTVMSIMLMPDCNDFGDQNTLYTFNMANRHWWYRCIFLLDNDIVEKMDSNFTIEQTSLVLTFFTGEQTFLDLLTSLYTFYCLLTSLSSYWNIIHHIYRTFMIVSRGLKDDWQIFAAAYVWKFLWS